MLYAVIEGGSQEGPGTLIGLFTNKDQALIAWQIDDYYRSIWEVLPDQEPKELTPIPVEWAVTVGYKASGFLGTIRDFKEFPAVAQKALKEPDHSIIFHESSDRPHATIRRDGPFEEGGTIFLNGLRIATVICVPSKWILYEADRADLPMHTPIGTPSGARALSTLDVLTDAPMATHSGWIESNP